MTCALLSRIVLTLLAGLCWAGVGMAAPEAWLRFDHVGIEQGLPQSQVYSVGQDARGYLWFGTLAGLARYNGRDFRVWTSADGLSGNQIDAIVAARDGQAVWVGTTSGLCRVGKVVRCADGPRLSARPVRALVRIDDTLWVATADGLLAVDPDRLRVSKVLLDSVAVSSLVRAGDHLWAGTRDGLVRIDPAAGTAELDAQSVALPPITSLQMVEDEVWIGSERGLWRFGTGAAPVAVGGQVESLARSHVSGIARGVDGRIWVATYRGLFRIDPGAGGTVWRIGGMRSDIIRSMSVDRQGVLWLGLDRGIARYVPTPVHGIDHRAGMIDDFVRALARDAGGNLWIGTRNGLQIVPLVDGWPQFEHATTLGSGDGLPDPRIYAIEFVSPTEAWIATNDGLARWRSDRGIVEVLGPEQGLPSHRVRALRVDARGRLWFGTDRGAGWIEDGKVHRFRESPLDQVYVLNIRHDADARAWFSTVEHGIVIRGADGEIRQVPGIGDSAVWDLWPVDDGRGMWAGSNGGGLLRVLPDGTIDKRYTTADGLPDNSIWSVLADARGAVWAYSTQGLSRIEGDRIVSFDLADGLPHSEGVSTAVLRGQSGRLWFGSVGGLARVDPEPVRLDRTPAPIVIERALVDGRALEPMAELAPDTAGITFEFAALDFRSLDGPRYRWRLLGLDSEWSDAAAYRPVTYGKLPPGGYQFQVQARTGHSAWNEPPATFRFRIAAQWWRHPAARAGAVLVLLTLLLAAVRLRERGLHHRARELHALVDERTEALREANEQLRRIATTDPLTGLKNRRFLMEQIEADLALARRRNGTQEGRISFLLLDLDGFKRINDEYGHLAGDAMLVQVARVMRRSLRDSDYVVRWGGDEFLIVARGVVPGESERLAERILGMLARQRFELSQTLRFNGCSASIGIADFPFGGGAEFGWDRLVEIADAAGYAVKRAGGGGWLVIEAGTAPIEEPGEFIRQLRENFAAFERQGRIVVRRGVPFRPQRTI